MRSNRWTCIVTDLDNSLLNEHSRISTLSQSVLHQLHTKGIMIVVATARHLSNAIDILQNDNLIDSVDYVISDNGAIIATGDKKVLYETDDFDETDVLRVLNLVNREYIVVTNDQHDIFVHKKISLKLAKKLLRQCFANRQKIIHHYSKVCFRSKGCKSILLPADVIVDDEILSAYNVYKESDVITILKKESSKMNALVWLSTEMKISLRNMLFFGDGMNDIEVFENLHYTIAMGNAIEDILSKAWKVADSNQKNGVAKALIELYGLKS